ncbi:MAG: DUF1697 domain-containing protein [Chitinophagales bacterium]|nr:DUF1697 domain-containing protein [Chitinophagales bacterium]
MRYCAFLRGVNISGTVMKMEHVCSLFEKNGMQNVSAFLASGNILFSSDKTKSILKKLLEKVMSEYFSYEAFLFVKDKREIESIVSNNPFEAHPELHIYSFAGTDGIEKILIQEFKKSVRSEGEEAKIVSGNFYWRISKGNTLNSEFGKILGNKKFRGSFTSRNMNTFVKVLKKM